MTLKKSLISIAVSVLLGSSLIGCGGSDEDVVVPEVSQPNPAKFFNRVSTFAVCNQVGASCESADTTAAEIVAASIDGMTLIYSNSPKGEVGFVDISDVKAPKALGALAMGGEPTSVTVLGTQALVAVNTRTDFVNVSGKLVVVDIATRKEVASIALPGQPDSVAVSKDGKYVAVVIENERDEDVNKGALPQLPAGSLVIVDVAGAASTWKTRVVSLTGLDGMLYPTDPEPEYVDINEANVAVVTLQKKQPYCAGGPGHRQSHQAFQRWHSGLDAG